MQAFQGARQDALLLPCQFPESGHQCSSNCPSGLVRLSNQSSAPHHPRRLTGQTGQIYAFLHIWKDMDLLFAVLVFLVASPAHGSSSYCFAPTVQAGNTATVTCYFDRDVSGSQFMVRRQCRQRAETVLDCYEKSGNTPYCEKLDEITYDWKPGKDQTLFIANVTKDSEGNYVCQHEESSAEEIQPCHLNVTEPAKIIDDSQQIPTEDEDKQQQESKPGHKDWVPVVVGSVVGTAVVLGAVIVFLAVLKRRRDQHKDARNGEMGNKEGNTSLRVEDETKPMEPSSASSSSASTTSFNAPETKSLIEKAPARSSTV